ncbi:hypothetical protein VTI74DRAFT_283 [Chaetomium olivicolor]
MYIYIYIYMDNNYLYIDSLPESYQDYPRLYALRTRTLPYEELASLSYQKAVILVIVCTRATGKPSKGKKRKKEKKKIPPKRPLPPPPNFPPAYPIPSQGAPSERRRPNTGPPAKAKQWVRAGGLLGGNVRPAGRISYRFWLEISSQARDLSQHTAPDRATPYLSQPAYPIPPPQRTTTN